MHYVAALNDVLHFWFASNDTSGSGNDGASAAADVRKGGDTASAIPIQSLTPTLLTHANYPAGCYEVEVTASVANGYVSDANYGIFCTLAVDSQNPTGFIGSFRTAAITANAIKISGSTTVANNIEQDYDGTGFARPNSTIGTCTTNTDMVGTDNAALASSLPTNFGDLAITATTGKVTVGTNSDKTGYSISGTKTTLDALNDPTVQAIVDGVWDEAKSAHVAVGSFGEQVQKDIASLVMASAVEGVITVKQALSIIGSAVAGETIGVETGNPQFRAMDDNTTTRIASSIVNNNRTSIVLTPP